MLSFTKKRCFNFARPLCNFCEIFHLFAFLIVFFFFLIVFFFLPVTTGFKIANRIIMEEIFNCEY